MQAAFRLARPRELPILLATWVNSCKPECDRFHICRSAVLGGRVSVERGNPPTGACT